VHTIEKATGGRRRRLYSQEFKASIVEACRHPGVSVAAVALAHGLNANLVRRWISEARESVTANTGPVPASKPAFVPVEIAPAPSAPPPTEISIQIQRGGTTVQLRWPLSATSEFAHWLREWLR
jgi:transposase-like protein